MKTIDSHLFALIFRNLLSLKNYEGDFDDIALNFTVMNGDLGNVEVGICSLFSSTCA